MAEMGRVQPNSLEAERSVLGSMLLSEQCALDGLDELHPEDFHQPRHRDIFIAMQELFEHGVAVDYVTVTEHLEKTGRMPAGGAEYLAELTSSVPSTANFEYYKQIIKEKAVLRHVIDIGMKMSDDAFGEKSDAEEILSRAGDAIYSVATQDDKRALTPLSKALVEAIARMQRAMESKDGLMGVPTGFPTLDRMLSGLQGTQMIVIAGRPGMGKTSFALNIVEHVGKVKQLPCLIYSMEMSADQIAGRLQCAYARVDAQKYRSASLLPSEIEKLAAASKELSEAPIYINDSSVVTVTEMMAQARKMKAQRGLALVMIDYLQLMTNSSRFENRQQEVSQISRSIKIMAKELDVPVLLLSQLSRANEKRDKGSRRPMLSDLRESGAIEQDADVVLFLHREDYYDDMRSEENEGQAEIIIAKQRSGPVGGIAAHFLKEYTRYEEVDTRHEEAPF